MNVQIKLDSMLDSAYTIKVAFKKMCDFEARRIHADSKILCSASVFIDIASIW